MQFNVNFSGSNLSELKINLARKFLKSLRVDVAEARNVPIAAFANDLIGIELMLKPFYERIELEFLIEFCGKIGIDMQNTCCIDIGANIGNHTIFFHKYFGTVFSFEANPRIYKLLEINTAELGNVTIFNKALGERHEKLRLYENFINYGGSSTKYTKNTKQSYDIQIARLDDCVESLYTKGIGLIKLDVEGMELQVLKGAESCIQKFKPLIVFEQLRSDFKAGESDAVNYLRSLGYKIYWIRNSLHERSWVNRRIRNFISLFTPLTEKLSLCSDDKLPLRDHSMLIAVFDK